MDLYYSRRGEESGWEKDINDIVDEIWREENPRVGSELTFLSGERKEKYIEDYIVIDALLEEIKERAYAKYPELADDYLDDVTQDQKEELEMIVSDWATKHKLHPRFYGIVNIKDVKIRFTKSNYSSFEFEIIETQEL